VTRRVLAAALLLSVALIAVVAANALRGPRQNGPLRTNSTFNVSFPLADNEVFVWGTNLPWDGDPAVGDIRIDSIEPVGTRGVEVLGLVLNNSVLQPDGICLSYGNRVAVSFPPPEVPTREVSGAVLSAAAGKACASQPSVLVGVRRSANSSTGRIDALRMLYHHRGTAYELVMPYGLYVCPGQVDAQGRRAPCTGFGSPTP
jgi:hypothetical protein